jgi:beta-lactamase class A
MEKQFAVITAGHCYLRACPGLEDGTNTSGIEDEIFSGWSVRLYPQTELRGWIRVQTHYGYEGYIYGKEYRSIDRETLRERQAKERFYRICIPEADLLSEPKVQGLPLEFLYKNALVELLPVEAAGDFCRVRTAAGREGYIHRRYLSERAEDDGFLLIEEEDPAFFRKQPLPEEEAFREAVASSARAYLGTQYRWGGKSSQGIDCSGLAFMSYLENGVLIYRDAKLMENYPIRPVGREQIKKGDLLYFPGHVAIYLGEGKFIHSTAWEKTPCVTINSLWPEDDDYRADLDEKLLGCGSLFPEDSFLEETLKKLESVPGNISFYYKNLSTGEIFSYRADAVHPSASLIKTFLMAAVYQEEADGNLSLDDVLTVRREDMVHSSGVLDLLSGEPQLSIRDLVELMIVVSDNTAANILYSYLGEERVNTYFQEKLHLRHTEFHRKMMDVESARAGIENYTTAREMSDLLEQIYRGELVSPQASKRMYETLSHQQLDGKIPFYLRGLPNPPVVAHKTGENDGVTHDAAIIEGLEPMVVSFLGSNTDIAQFERVMAEITRDLYSRVQKNI